MFSNKSTDDLGITLTVFGSAAWLEFVHVNREKYPSRILSVHELETLSDKRGALFVNGAAWNAVIRNPAVSTLFEPNTKEGILSDGLLGQFGKVRVFTDIFVPGTHRWLPQFDDRSRPLFWFFETPDGVADVDDAPEDWCIDPDCDCAADDDEEAIEETTNLSDCDCDCGGCDASTVGVPVYTHRLAEGDVVKYLIDGKDVYGHEFTITGDSRDEIMDIIATTAYRAAEKRVNGSPIIAVYIGMRMGSGENPEFVQSFDIGNGQTHYGASVAITGVLRPADESLLEGLTLLHRVTV